MSLPNTKSAINPASARPGPIFWAILGFGVAIAIQAAQASSLGGWSGLLAVGETSPLRPIIEQELPNLVVTDDPGHDGQVTYVVGLDPWATWAHEIVPAASYRYRRILMPLVASGFGTVDGTALFWSLTILNGLAFAAATVFTAKLATMRSLPPWAALAATLNIGLWLSLHITSPDALGFACVLVGIVAYLAGGDLRAVIWLSLGGLAKETYLLVPLSIVIYLLMVHREKRRGLFFTCSFIPAALWSVFLAVRIRDPFQTGGNLSLPFVGILDASKAWAQNSGRDIVLLVLAVGAIGVSVLLIVKAPRSLWAWLAVPWLALATISSHWIWDFGNNAARAFLPLVTFAALGLMDNSDLGADPLPVGGQTAALGDT